MSDIILLEGIQIPAALGVTAAERRMRRPVTLDLEVMCDLRPAGTSDQIRRTIEYERIFEVVEDVAGNHEHRLVEALGSASPRRSSPGSRWTLLRSRCENPSPSPGFSTMRG